MYKRSTRLYRIGKYISVGFLKWIWFYNNARIVWVFVRKIGLKFVLINESERSNTVGGLQLSRFLHKRIKFLVVKYHSILLRKPVNLTAGKC